jgi:hypothetical protein
LAEVVLFGEIKPLGKSTGESLVAGRSEPTVAVGDGTVVAGTFNKDTS